MRVAPGDWLGAIIQRADERLPTRGDVNNFLTRFRRLEVTGDGDEIMMLLSEEFCPISESLLGRLYRSSPEGVAALIRTVPPNTRARLAYYCSRRAHLEAIGLVIAGTCSQEDLYDAAGRAGWDLFARAKATPSPGPKRTTSRRGITLASGSLWDVPKPRD